MAIELSNLTFTEQDDIVPASGVEQILNTGVANTLAGNDSITGIYDGFSISNSAGIYNIGTLNAGEGNDIITGISYFSGLINSGTINTGEGDDTILGIGRGTGIASSEGSIFDTGDGNDIIRAQSIYNYSNSFTTGDGNDTISAGSAYGPDIFNEGLINTGNGEDYIIAGGGLLNNGGVFLGEGNDWLHTTGYSIRTLENFNFIGTGDGNDIISSTGIIYNQGVIETGNGDDSIIADGGFDYDTGTTYSIYNNGGAINMGDGNDSIIANEGFKSAENSSGAWFLGEGDDYIKGYGSGDFYGGNGNDTLELTPGTYTVGIWGEGQDTSVIFTKGNSLMITSEFEQLIAGGTTYNFANLTADQTIVVA